LWSGERDHVDRFASDFIDHGKAKLRCWPNAKVTWSLYERAMMRAMGKVFECQSDFVVEHLRGIDLKTMLLEPNDLALKLSLSEGMDNYGFHYQ
jgi:hypothetical protein